MAGRLGKTTCPANPRVFQFLFLDSLMWLRIGWFCKLAGFVKRSIAFNPNTFKDRRESIRKLETIYRESRFSRFEHVY
ncbi:MAG TPA: hypothetical protein VKM55_08055 [Candidatus Lokiarchaeia archaeon]|nr:hypothetical protein [Candidatus Lokiarchaeia archaeon]